MKVTIVGLGLIGGSLAIDLREAGFASEVRGVDQNEEHVLQARNRGLCDEILSLPESLREADLVILAIPVDAIHDTLPFVLDEVGPQTTVTDMGSTKKAIGLRVESHLKRKQYVASHPMAGTEYSGPLAAVRGLFQSRTTVICDPEKSDAFHLRRIDALFDALGMRRTYMSSAEHDLHAAYISHLSHISSFVLANTVLDKERDVSAIFNLAGGGFESTVRLAKSSPAMWGPIFLQNRDPILKALDAYMDHLEAFRKTLRESQPKETNRLMNEANSIKRVLQNIRVAK
jgi:prephenate dehydrogenase